MLRSFLCKGSRGTAQRELWLKRRTSLPSELHRVRVTLSPQEPGRELHNGSTPISGAVCMRGAVVQWVHCRGCALAARCAGTSVHCSTRPDARCWLQNELRCLAARARSSAPNTQKSELARRVQARAKMSARAARAGPKSAVRASCALTASLTMRKARERCARVRCSPDRVYKV